MTKKNINVDNVIKTGVKTIQELIAVIEYAKTSKTIYKNAIQTALEYFVKEYNGALTYNTTPFKAICETVGKDVKDLRQWLFTYTNMTKVNADLLHFETDEGYFVKDSDGKDKKVFTLKFRDSYNGQKWYETADKTDKEALKELTSDDLMKSLKAIFRRYTKNGNEYDTKEQNILNAIKTAYGL